MHYLKDERQIKNKHTHTNIHSQNSVPTGDKKTI